MPLHNPQRLRVPQCLPFASATTLWSICLLAMLASPAWAAPPGEAPPADNGTPDEAASAQTVSAMVKDAPKDAASKGAAPAKDATGGKDPANDRKAKGDRPQPESVESDGVLVSPESREYKANFQEIKSLAIRRILPHGTRVDKGDDLLWLETDDADKQLRDAESEFRLAEIAFREAEFKHEQFLESQKLDREAAERSIERARQDYENFVRVDRDRQLETAENNLKNAKVSLENAREELEQLEKMYRDDDLTEESEEIVLKRARHAVEQAEFRLENTRIQTTRAIEQTIPRAEVDQEQQLRRAEMAFESTRRSLDFDLKRRNQEMEAERRKMEDRRKQLDRLRQERKRMVVKAPVTGIVLHGPLNRGALSDKPSSLDSGSKLSADQVVLTVAPTEPLRVRLTIPEKQLRHFAAGTRAEVVPDAYPEMRLEAWVESLADVPFAAGKYDCLIAIRGRELPAGLVPAMGCRVKVTAEPQD